MDQQTLIADIEGRAQRLGVSISDICRRAEIHPTTFSRWKKSERNPNPIGATLKSLSAIQAELTRLEQNRSDAYRAAPSVEAA